MFLLPLIAFSIIFSKYYKEIEFIANKKNEILDTGEEIILDNGVGFPINDSIKECKKVDNDLINTDLLSLTLPKNEKIINCELTEHLPGTKISIHPSILSNNSNSWIMNAPPHLVSNGQGQGY
jgi:hypothetical protein